MRVDGQLAVGRLGNRSDTDLSWETELFDTWRAGMTVPVPIPTLDGRYFADGLVVMTYVEGGPPKRRPTGVASPTHPPAAPTDARLAPTSGLAIGDRPPARGNRDEDRPRRDAAGGCRRYRAAWARLTGRERCVVHGDPNPGNIRITADRVALIDWDESHVDVPDLDLVLPHDAAGLDTRRARRCRASTRRMGSRCLLGPSRTERVRGRAARRSSSGRAAVGQASDPVRSQRGRPVRTLGIRRPARSRDKRFRLEPLEDRSTTTPTTRPGRRRWNTSARLLVGRRATWPDDRSADDNLRDLQSHAEDFENRTGFTYTVLDPASGDVIGCVYIYPDKSGQHDVRVRSWVRASRAELDVRAMAGGHGLAHRRVAGSSIWPTPTAEPRRRHVSRSFRRGGGC